MHILSTNDFAASLPACDSAYKARRKCAAWVLGDGSGDEWPVDGRVIVAESGETLGEEVGGVVFWFAAIASVLYSAIYHALRASLHDDPLCPLCHSFDPTTATTSS